MPSFTLYEYDTLTRSDEPVEPHGTPRTGLAFGQAHRLAASTLYFRVVPDVDARIRVSEAGDTATSADKRVYGDVGTGGYSRQGQRPYVYLISA